MERVVPEGSLLGLDFGDKSVGVAHSDALGLFSHGIETIYRERPAKLRRTLSRIEALCVEYDIVGVVIGLPLLYDGTEGERCKKTREFGGTLSKRINLPICFWDERCTTIEADERMRLFGLSKKQRTDRIDEASAVVILQDFLDNVNAQGRTGADIIETVDSTT